MERFPVNKEKMVKAAENNDCLERRFKRFTELQKKLVEKIKNPQKTFTVVIAGKYTRLSDAYISVVESLKHAGYKHDAQIDIIIESTK